MDLKTAIPWMVGTGKVAVTYARGRPMDCLRLKLRAAGQHFCLCFGLCSILNMQSIA